MDGNIVKSWEYKKTIKMEDIINWIGLSRKLAGNETSISRNRIPKKYKPKVDALIDALKNWEETNKTKK